MDQMTGRSRGFAFVVFVEVDTLTTVLSQDHAIKGKKVAVKKVKSFCFLTVGSITLAVLGIVVKSMFSFDREICFFKIMPSRARNWMSKK